MPKAPNSHASWGALQRIPARSAARSAGAKGSCGFRMIAPLTERPMDAGDVRGQGNQSLQACRTGFGRWRDFGRVTQEIGGPRAANNENKDKLYEELVERFNDAGLDVPYETSTAFRKCCNDIDSKREGQIKAAVSAGMLVFNAIGYGLNERINLGLVGLAGQVRFAHCIGLIGPLAVVYSIASCTL